MINYKVLITGKDNVTNSFGAMRGMMSCFWHHVCGSYNKQYTYEDYWDVLAGNVSLN